MGLMKDYILDQPQVLQQILDGRKANTKAFVQQMVKYSPDRLYLIASGSSQNAAAASVDFMEKVLGIEVVTFAPSYISQIRGERPFVIFVSQGGNSTNTLRAIAQLAAYPCIALTGSEQNRVNEICDSHILIGCGVENVGPKTKGYTATVMSLYLLALESALAQGKQTQAAYDKIIQGLQTMAKQMPANIASTQQWFADNANAQKTMKKCCVVGKNLAFQAAKECALKLIETLLIPATAYEFEEYLHGPSSSIDADMGGIYFLPDKADEDYERIVRLAEFHRSICPQVYMIGADVQENRQDCRVAINEEYSGTFAWLLSGQLMSAELPEMLGIEGKGSAQFETLSKALDIKYKGGA